MTAVAGLLSLLLGVGFGLPCAYGIRHLARTGEVWTFLGFPTYGGGPFEKAGLATSVPLLVGFLAVCVAEVVLGIMLLTGSPSAPVLSCLLLPLELVFWVGFALPFGLLLGLLRAVLLLIAAA